MVDDESADEARARAAESSAPREAIIVVAAGAGERLGAAVPKAFVSIDEQSILRHALRGVFTAAPAHVVIVAPAPLVGRAREDAIAVAREHDPRRAGLISVVAGGESRQQSVAAGLAALGPGIERVLVHDAARALTPPAVFDRVIGALRDGASAVVPVLPVVDSLKRVDGQRVVEAVAREHLAVAQTPQGFDRALLASASASASDEHSDDASLVQAAGASVSTVAGDARAFKITAPADLDRARAVLAADARGAASDQRLLPRVGIGTDAHAFGDASHELWLAGVHWPGEVGLRGHSDGDAVAHAIVDAVLAAAGLGDIGTHFGTDRPEFEGAHAAVFLAETRRLVTAAGWRIGNVSVQVQANRPRFSHRRAEAERVLSDALGAPVQLSATTSDGLGFTGRGEGVHAVAVAMLIALR